jgi:hypothetical protein
MWKTWVGRPLAFPPVLRQHPVSDPSPGSVSVTRCRCDPTLPSHRPESDLRRVVILPAGNNPSPHQGCGGSHSPRHGGLHTFPATGGAGGHLRRHTRHHRHQVFGSSRGRLGWRPAVGHCLARVRGGGARRLFGSLCETPRAALGVPESGGRLCRGRHGGAGGLGSPALHRLGTGG